MQKSLSAAFFLSACLGAPAGRDAALEQPRELGSVRWVRNLEEGRRMARERDRPILLLFQEIPGCSTCVSFGAGPLSHPLLVEAIEDEFVPVAIYNNRPGPDAEVLAQFEEPAWNNPVVRFLAPDGGELIPRRDAVWDVHGIAVRIAAALKAAGRPIPAYLNLAEDEARSEHKKRTAFAMHCFWEGEAELGGLEGVVATRVGWYEGQEAVEVEYRSDRIGQKELLARAESLGCRSLAASSIGPAKASDHKFHLRRTFWRFLPMTALQASRINAELSHGGDPRKWISPRQAALAERLAKAERACGGSFPEPRAESIDAGTLHDAAFTAEIARRLEACEEAAD